MTLEELHRKMAALGLVHGTSGNASIRVRSETDWITIKPSGYRCDDIDGTDIVYVPYGPYDGRHILPAGITASTDLPIHMKIYEARKDINCVIHTHSPFASAYSIFGRSLKPFTTGSAELFDRIPCLSLKKGMVIEPIYIEKYPAVLIHKHGVFCWGKTPEETLSIAENVEWASRIALLMQDRTEPMEPEEIEECQSWYQENYGQK